MTIWISGELLLFNFERLYMWCKSDLQVKSYDHLNCSIASIVQFRASRYISRMNRSSELKFMTIWIAQELPLLNFERLDILRAWIRPLSEKLWPFKFLESFRCSILSISIYFAPDRSSELKVMTIWIAQELTMLNFECLDILCAWIGPLSEKLWPFEFLESFRSSISSVSIYYAPESDLRVKS